MFDNFTFPFQKKIKILKILGLLIVLGLFAFSLFSFSKKRCDEIEIKISNKINYPFLKEEDILTLSTLNHKDALRGKLMSEIDLVEIERRLLKNKLIENCQVHKGMGKVLFIDVTLQEPIARFINNDANNGYYVNKKGDIFQLSNQFTARVLALTGSFFKHKKTLKDQYFENDVLNLINRINEEEFWKAQITQIDIDSVRNIRIVPLVGNHLVDFGRPTNIENKLTRLKMFYRTILSDDKYKNFKKVSVKFKDQIVCE